MVNKHLQSQSESIMSGECSIKLLNVVINSLQWLAVVFITTNLSYRLQLKKEALFANIDDNSKSCGL
jgi:hypothetical protein